MPRKRKLPRSQEIAMFAKRGSRGLSSKDLHLSNPTHTRPSHFNTQTGDPRFQNFIYTGIGKKKIVKKSIIPQKKQPEPKSTQFIPKITPNKDFSKFIKPMQKISKDKNAKIVGGAIATGLTILTGNPVPLLVYKALITANILNDLSNRMEKMYVSRFTPKSTSLHKKI